MFNLKNTNLYEATQLEKTFKFLSIIRTGLFLLFIFFIALITINFWTKTYEPKIIQISEGLALITFSLYLYLKTLNAFFQNLKNPSLKKPLNSVTTNSKANLAEWLSFKTTKYLNKSFELAKRTKLAKPTSSILLYSLLDEKNQKIIFLFSRLSININTFKKDVEDSIWEKRHPDDSCVFEEIILEAANSSIKRNGTHIKEGDLLSALCDFEPNLKKLLIDMEMGREDMENISWWIESANNRMRQNKTFGNYENLLKNGSIANDLAFGYTPTLDKFSIDWTSQVSQRGYEEIIGHKQEIDLLEKILSRKGPKNALLIGNPGSNRKEVIHSIIKKSITNQSLPSINNKKFVQLDIVSLSANISSFEDTERIINDCLIEAISAGNIVLIINDFHDFLGAERKAGIVDISGIISSYLQHPRIQTICLTTPQGLHKYIETKPGILSLFEKIDVPELSAEETMLILENKVFTLERDYQKFITYPALKEIICLSERYVSAPFPQKAISLMQDAFTYSSKFNTDIIAPENIDQILSQKIKIPLGKVKSAEKETLLNLENSLHKRVVSQNEAIKEISSAMRRARSGVQDRKGPMGNFLFLGPTGVGKTETAKALAAEYFGSEDRMVRIDMSEFQRLDDIPRLIGSDTQNGILTTQIRENPFSLVLLDEIEKAHPNILNLFLQVLDEGYVNDNLGNKVKFNNSIIIATSNAGHQIILNSIKENKNIEEIKKELFDYIFANNLFRPEFVNRFDGVVVFKSLTQTDLLQIAQIQLNKIKNTLKNKKISFIITDELKNKIAQLSYDPIFGAREMRRVIQDNVENSIAKALLGDKIVPGNTIEINPETFEIIVK
ncbi:MAG: AAA family ATPase [Candidatus Paceibacterota bacterium]|jgi:ATP-dependent Clp protease ATP-binding subunit ClpC